MAVFTPPLGLAKITVEDRERERLEKLKQSRADCEAKGGVFDEATGTCKLPEQPTPEPETPGIQETGRIQTIFDQETGRPTAIIRDGKTFFLPEEDIRSIGAEEAAATAPVIGAPDVQVAIAAKQLQNNLLKLGQINQVQGVEQDLDFSEAITAGLIKGLPSAAFGVVGAAALGAKVGAPGGVIGIAAGAGVGAAYGIYTNFIGNLEDQQKGQIQANIERYNTALRGLRQIALLATTYPDAAPQLITDFNTQKSLIHQAYADVKVETDEDIEKYIEDGTAILAKFDSVIDPDTGLLSIYETRLRLAITRGVPMDDMAVVLEAAEIELE